MKVLTAAQVKALKTSSLTPSSKEARRRNAEEFTGYPTPGSVHPHKPKAGHLKDSMVYEVFNRGTGRVHQGTFPTRELAKEFKRLRNLNPNGERWDIRKKGRESKKEAHAYLRQRYIDSQLSKHPSKAGEDLLTLMSWEQYQSTQVKNRP